MSKQRREPQCGGGVQPITLSAEVNGKETRVDKQDPAATLVESARPAGSIFQADLHIRHSSQFRISCVGFGKSRAENVTCVLRLLNLRILVN